MRLLNLTLSLLFQLRVAHAAYTLSEVEAQISSYLAHNGTYTARSTPPSGCQLAVSSASTQCKPQ
jgi:hypothetical protein